MADGRVAGVYAWLVDDAGAQELAAGHGPQLASKATPAGPPPD